MALVWDDPDLKHRSELLVMLAIADYANENGKAWPSIDSLAAKSRTTPRQVQKVIAALCQRSKLTVDMCAGPYKTNIYSILVGGVKWLHPEVAGSKSEPASSPDPSVSVSIRQYPLKTEPVLDEVILFCEKNGINRSDAEWFFHKCEGNGWTNGGKPIKRWGSTLLAWKLAGHLASQKNYGNNKTNGTAANKNARSNSEPDYTKGF